MVEIVVRDDGSVCVSFLVCWKLVVYKVVVEVQRWRL